MDIQSLGATYPQQAWPLETPESPQGTQAGRSMSSERPSASLDALSEAQTH